MIHPQTITQDTQAIIQAHVASLQASADRHKPTSNTHAALYARWQLKRGLEALMGGQNKAVKHG